MTPDIDIINPDVYQRGGAPHDQFAWLRANDPVHWHYDPNEDVPGFWAVTKYTDVQYVSRHPELFSSARRTSMFDEFSPEDIAFYGLMMLFMDPPAHTRKRGMVNKGFTPRMVKQLEEHIRDITNDLIDKALPKGEIDFVDEIAAPLPLYVICELLGAPVEDRQKLYDWSNQLLGFDDPDYNTSYENAAVVAAEVMGYAAELADLRRAKPGDDIATKLLQPDSEGKVLTDEEFQLFVLMLIIAGNETTRNGASHGVLTFAEHPDQWQRLLANGGLTRSAVDEVVRYCSPLNLFRRTATRDTVIGDQPITEGDKVVMFYGSANRDEEIFTDPNTFDIGRDPNPHIGFGGGGPHFCLGSHLAKLELTVLFETLTARMPDIALAGEPRRLRSNFVLGIKELPVRFTPSR